METNSLRDRQENHAQYYGVKLKSGLFYQDFVIDTCWNVLGLAIVQYASKEYQFTVGESRGGVEIKNDEQYCKTGNLYIEVGEKAKPRPGPFAPSGIRRDDNSWLYIIGDFNTIFIYDIHFLRMLQDSGKYPIIEIKRGTSQGFLLKGAKNEPKKYAAKILTPNAEEKIMQFHSKFREQMKLGKELIKLLNADSRQSSLFDSNGTDEDDNINDPILQAIDR